VKKVFIMSSVHPWNDTRIFFKEAQSLAKKYEVELHAVADFSFKESGGVKVFGLPKSKKRVLRFVNWFRLLFRALKSGADVYHFHDPELLGLGWLIKVLTGKKVIYDVHEDFPAALLTKYWIPKGIRRTISRLMDKWEKWISQRLDALIFAEFYYKENFMKVSTKKADIVNYPVLSMERPQDRQEGQTVVLVYAGGITESRGAVQMVESIALLREDLRKRVRLVLIGTVKKELMERLQKIVAEKGIQNEVLFTGRVSLTEVYEYYKSAGIGLAVLHPAQNYIRSLATKIYEYMSVGIPIIASNFPMWIELVEGNQCGINVDPLDPKAIAEAIERLVLDPELRKQMGQNGYRAFKEKYNWSLEEEKLFELYDQLLGEGN